jgi:hypothetical protein
MLFPKLRGVTSIKIRSFIPPFSIPAYIAAPVATASSGFIDLFGYFWKKSVTFCYTIGILEEPPTNSTSFMSFRANPESLMHCFTHISVLLIKGSINDSYSFLLIVCEKWV